MNQRTYIVIALALFILALVIAVVIWILLMRAGSELMQMAEPAREAIPALQDAWQGLTGDTAPTRSNEEGLDSAASGAAPEVGSAMQRQDIPLSSLALTPEQRALAESFGINVDSFVITGAMQVCAEETLGAERFAAVLAGEAPNLIEGSRLLRCLNP